MCVHSLPFSIASTIDYCDSNDCKENDDDDDDDENIRQQQWIVMAIHVYTWMNQWHKMEEWERERERKVTKQLNKK